ncbi:hypothetical protein [uncultured Winogradskyella sp.]|uniref:hypothetical protein n=1 Tax=uncultured Winogradskyella sp. TaxID=395353 RepID=UPI002624D72B|nr:hypothetical protein [uncultured Winogradskyella sp.]|tara:strand:+ start:139 stop:504 length:366 start_codon:yes stop_codon:yes gene_type:complete
MAFEEFKENLLQADVNIHGYIESSEEYIKLKSFKALMIGVLYITKIIIIGALLGITLLILSFAFAFRLAQVLDNTFYGFLIVGGFYALVALITYVFRSKLNGPLLRKFSNYYFTKDDTKKL